MERPEAMDSGSIILTGHDKEVVLKSLELVIEQIRKNEANAIPLEYEITNASWRIVKLILGTAKLSNNWNSIIKID